MSSMKISARGFAIVGLGLVLASCVVESGPPLGPGPIFIPDGPEICTREYAPVCARRGPREETFSNACVARSEDFRVIYPGECRFAGPGPGGPGRPDFPGRPGGPGGFCTREYAPVCAVRGGRAETFPNECEAESEGFRIVADGECRMSRQSYPRG